MIEPTIQTDAIRINALRVPLCIQRFDPSNDTSTMLSMMNVPHLRDERRLLFSNCSRWELRSLGYARDDKGEGRCFHVRPFADGENSRSPFDFTQGRLSISLRSGRDDNLYFGWVRVPKKIVIPIGKSQSLGNLFSLSNVRYGSGGFHFGKRRPRRTHSFLYVGLGVRS